MRTNIYNEEITGDVALVTRKSDTGLVFYGLRFNLQSPPSLHYTEDGDDRSAVTFWFGHNITSVMKFHNTISIAFAHVDRLMLNYNERLPL